MWRKSHWYGIKLIKQKYECKKYIYNANNGGPRHQLFVSNPDITIVVE